jgi:dienelactone hydrolase
MLAHGLHYTPEDMMRIALAKPSGPGDAYRHGSIYKWDPPEPPSGAILVAHDGYRNAGQRPPGEVDVRRVIDEVQAAYRIDRRRVSISGFSLGGSVAFWVPFHAFSVFSATTPNGGACARRWSSSRRSRKPHSFPS